MSTGWAALRQEQSAGGFTGHRGGWFGGGPEETQRTHKMDFTDVACQLIGTAKKYALHNNCPSFFVSLVFPLFLLFPFCHSL